MLLQTYVSITCNLNLKFWNVRCHEMVISHHELVSFNNYWELINWLKILMHVLLGVIGNRLVHVQKSAISYNILPDNQPEWFIFNPTWLWHAWIIHKWNFMLNNTVSIICFFLISIIILLSTFLTGKREGCTTSIDTRQEGSQTSTWQWLMMEWIKKQQTFPGSVVKLKRHVIWLMLAHTLLGQFSTLGNLRLVKTFMALLISTSGPMTQIWPLQFF